MEANNYLPNSPTSNDLISLPDSSHSWKRPLYCGHLIKSPSLLKSYKRWKTTWVKTVRMASNWLPAHDVTQSIRGTPSPQWRWNMHNPLGILEWRMAGQALPQVFLPTIMTVQRRNNCPARHPYEGRQSYHHFSLETRYPGQNSNWSSGHSEMPRESS